MLHLAEQQPVGIGLFLQWQGIGAGGGRHAPEAKGAAGDPHVDKPSYGRDVAAKGIGSEAGGLLAGGDERSAIRNLGQQGRDVGGGDYLQEGVGGIVLEPAHFGGGVVERQTFLFAEGPDGSLVKTLLARDAKMSLVSKIDEPHNPPEIVDPVGVIEWHAPPMQLGRKTAQK